MDHRRKYNTVQLSNIKYCKYKMLYFMVLGVMLGVKSVWFQVTTGWMSNDNPT